MFFKSPEQKAKRKQKSKEQQQNFAKSTVDTFCELAVV